MTKIGNAQLHPERSSEIVGYRALKISVAVPEMPLTEMGTKRVVPISVDNSC